MSAFAAAAFAAASMASTLPIYVYDDALPVDVVRVVSRGLPSRFVSAGWGCSLALPRRDASVAAGCPAGLAFPVGGRRAFRGCPEDSRGCRATRRCCGALRAAASGSLREGSS